jgi:hypothetical protein
VSVRKTEDEAHVSDREVGITFDEWSRAECRECSSWVTVQCILDTFSVRVELRFCVIGGSVKLPLHEHCSLERDSDGWMIMENTFN